MTHQQENIRTRADGSIDTAYYMARGRRLRSEAAHAMFQPEPKVRRPRRGIARLFGGVFA
ncbi:hypothetical protein KUW09_09590 [Mameliella alba]|nr:hypothetical protein [Antarctobacter heliothermus]MBY6144292.1 hypothetical protein [Mameliella alba]MCA0954341.1 hypothetical protein [Mameliella alba]